MGDRDLTPPDAVIVLFGGEHQPPRPPFVSVETHEQAELFRRVGPTQVDPAEEEPR